MKKQSKVVKASFTGSKITKYSGLNTVAKYMDLQNIVKSISTLFPAQRSNATKFGVNQILMAITLAFISGINRICRIASFSGDGLVKTLLKLDKAINENALSVVLKDLRQNCTRKLQQLLLSKNGKWLHKSELRNITLDADSTVKSVCGNQEGEAKAKTPQRKEPKAIKMCLSVPTAFFCSRALFDLLESFVWDYMAKVKLKNLEKLLRQQIWTPLEVK